ncbi:MAG: hypothetical protein GTO02_19645 [Candidatus Dadabacteria bacterium]|nr:hypothetical protein [Candidatus Dadabacteria bacterium]NIQ16522.1 hypothetical protein [Candidatus Dadabacteria bacterium]
MSKRTQWKIYSVIVIILSVIAFTPLVVPYGIADPFFLGLPRTLWLGMSISIGIYIILVIAMLTSDGED